MSFDTCACIVTYYEFFNGIHIHIYIYFSVRTCTTLFGGAAHLMLKASWQQLAPCAAMLIFSVAMASASSPPLGGRGGCHERDLRTNPTGMHSLPQK